MKMKHIGDFMDYIRLLAKKNDDLMFPTNTLEEAAIVMAEILRHSNNKVRIYDHCLNGDISDKSYVFHSQLYQFLKQGKSLEIVLRSREKNDSKIFNDLITYSSDFPNQIELRLASREFMENMKDVLTHDANFMVSDNKAFRLELSERTSSNNFSCEAMCSFNNAVVSKKLDDAFTAQYASCEKVRTPILSN